MHKEYWCYQKRKIDIGEYPWAILIDKDFTPKNPDSIEICATIYCESIDNPTHGKVIEIGHKEHVMDYLNLIVSYLGDYSTVTHDDITQLSDFLIDVLVH